MRSQALESEGALVAPAEAGRLMGFWGGAWFRGLRFWDLGCKDLAGFWDPGFTGFLV